MLLFVNNLKKPWEPVFFSDQPSTNPQKTSHVGWRESDHHMDGSLVACQYQLLYLPTLQGLGSWTWTKKHIYYNYMHLEPKWGLLLWLEFRPCLVRLIFKNRSYLGSRYIYIIYIYIQNPMNTSNKKRNQTASPKRNLDKNIWDKEAWKSGRDVFGREWAPRFWRILMTFIHLHRSYMIYVNIMYTLQYPSSVL